MHYWKSLLQFCITEKQTVVCQMRIEGITVESIAQELKITERNIWDICLG